MDLQDFEGQDLYFNAPLTDKVAELINRAAELYGEGEAEKPLLRAFFLEPEHHMVHVALYRFYYYQHRYQDALFIADKAMAVARRELNLPEDWRDLERGHLGVASMQSMGMLRFYLLALKGAGYLNLRLGNIEAAIEILSKLVALDEKNRLGAEMLLSIAKERALDNIAEQSDNVVRFSLA
jgi:tetratricopeptide (TPR) repeat protein